MDFKRSLIRNLPPRAKRVLATPYDFYQTRKADTRFAAKDLVERQTSKDAPNHIIWIVIDAMRSDHVDENTTPYLASLDGTSAITPGAWTFPAVSSLLTGVYPHEHGAMKQTDEPDDSPGLTLPPRMDESRETLTEALAGAGYETYGGFGHDTPFVALSGEFKKHALYHDSSARDVLDDYLDWVEGRDKTFAFLHLADPHIPVNPPDKYWKKYDVDRSIDDLENWSYHHDVNCDDACQAYRDNRRRLYRASVDYVDDELARFADRVNERLDDPLQFITADHGEAMWEHIEMDLECFDGTGCVDHGGAPYEELARVPLLVSGNSTLDFDGGYVSLLDLHTTVLDLVGLDEVETAGYSLATGVPEGRIPLIEGSLNGHEKKGVYFDGYKLIISKGDDATVRFTVPGQDQVEVPNEVEEQMIDALPPWPDEDQGAQTNVSGVVEDRLETLGYK